MYAQLENTDKIIQRLFDPREHYKNIPLAAKYMYLQHFLESKWKEICGANLAKSCSVWKIEGSDLYVRTANSLLANELYMMQNLFLQKINACLLGRIVIKKIYFHSGAVIKRQEQKELEAKQTAVPAEYISCPSCGAKMQKGLEICSVCARERKEKLQRQLAELLRIQPWLKYEDCFIHYKCDKIIFTAVKDRLKNYYFEKVRLGYASKNDSLLAVLFLTEKQPDDLTPALYENALEYLRRDQSVSAFGSRFYGKK